MSFTEFCIKRPVFTLVLTAIIIIVGVISGLRLNVRQLPNISQAVVSITTQYDGASPDLIEKEITKPIENALSSISGIDLMQSESRLGRSQVSLSFPMNADMTDAVAEIRNKMSAIGDQLPQGTKAPVVYKSESEDNPSLILGFSDSTKNALEITDYLNRYIKPQVEEVAGVAQVFYFGGREYAIKIWLDAAQMAAHQVSVSEIKSALLEQNVEIPSGQFKSKKRYYTVITDAKFERAQDFKKLIIKDKNGYITRLEDVAKLRVEALDDDNLLRINKQSAVGLGIIPQSTANPVEVANSVMRLVEKLRPNLPAGMKVNTVYDTAIYIKQSLIDVVKTMIEAVLCVMLVVYLFLGNVRSSLIPIVTVPICLIGVLWPMHLLGFSLNTITLLALVLAIGLVVDDAIVMLENIYRHMQQEPSIQRASIKGAKEIVFAIIAMTLTLAAVYAPLSFIPGFTGQLFTQFGITLSLAVVLSGVVALSLSPMMCAQILRLSKTKFSIFVDKLFDALTRKYRYSLLWSFKHWKFIGIFLFLFSALGVYCFNTLPSELAPKEDQGVILGIMKSPTDASFDYTKKYAQQLEEIYSNVKDKNAFLVAVGYPDERSVFSVLRLKPWGEREASQEKISNNLQRQFKDIIGVNAFAVSPSPLARRHRSNNGFEIVIMTSSDYGVLNEITDNVVARLKHYPGLTNVENRLQLNSEQFHLSIDRNFAADLGVRLSDISETISTMLGGNNPVNYSYEGQTYPVWMQLAKNDRQNPASLNALYVTSARDKMIPLRSLVKIREDVGPLSLPHYNRLRSAQVTAELAPGYTLGGVISEVSSILQKSLPDNAQYSFAGASKDYLESKGSTELAFILALLFIYLVMAAQFESFHTPFIILLSVPWSMIGALIALKLSGSSLNLYSNIGMVTLIGLIAKHGILITEFGNQRLQQGMDLLRASLSAASLRLRPILMTTAAMVLGALPLALASGAGAHARQQIGWTIVGGMTLGTIFSLYVIPMVFVLWGKQRKKALHRGEASLPTTKKAQLELCDDQ